MALIGDQMATWLVGLLFCGLLFLIFASVAQFLTGENLEQELENKPEPVNVHDLNGHKQEAVEGVNGRPAVDLNHTEGHGLKEEGYSCSYL